MAGLQAIKLDESLAEAHTALAGVYSLEWNWAGAESELRRAIELNPRYARAFHVQAFSLMLKGRNDEAIASIERARELDPLNLVVNTDKGILLFIANRWDEAFDQWKKTLELDPNFALAYLHQANAYRSLGNDAASVEMYSRFLELSEKPPAKVAEYRNTASKFGIAETYRRELNEMLSKKGRGERVSSVGIATMYCLLGQKDEAFKYLEIAFSEHTAEMVLLKSDAQFESMRSDPRYADMIRRLGLADR